MKRLLKYRLIIIVFFCSCNHHISQQNTKYLADDAFHRGDCAKAIVLCEALKHTIRSFLKLDNWLRKAMVKILQYCYLIYPLFTESIRFWKAILSLTIAPVSIMQ